MEPHQIPWSTSAKENTEERRSGFVREDKMRTVGGPHWRHRRAKEMTEKQVRQREFRPVSLAPASTAPQKKALMEAGSGQATTEGDQAEDKDARGPKRSVHSGGWRRQEQSVGCLHLQDYCFSE